MAASNKRVPERQSWLSHDEVVAASTDELRAALNEAYTHMSDQQHKLVTFMLEGKPDMEAAELAGYSTRTSNTGWRARKTKKVVAALAIGREIAQRGAETSPEWVRSELKAALERAKAAGDEQNVIACIREFCKIDGIYAEQQMRLLHSGHDGGPLQKDVTDEEWAMLAQLQHNIIDVEHEEDEEAAA